MVSTRSCRCTVLLPVLPAEIQTVANSRLSSLSELANHGQTFRYTFLGKSCRRFVRKYYSGAMVEGATALPFRIIWMPTVIIQIASGKLEAKASGPKPAGL